VKRLTQISVITALLATGGCRNGDVASHPSGLPLRYRDARYDLTFFLPASWQGYSVSVKQIEDQRYSPLEDKDITVGYTPMITLRHPQWQATAPYADIPILIFTPAQWDSLRHGELWPSAFTGGTIDELWHNQKYVFAMSSRTFANDELKGWKETARIVERNRNASN
jgi:hypothetical protein